MRYGDRILGICVVIVGLATFLETRAFPDMPGNMPGPALFPRIISALLVGFGLLVLARPPAPTEEVSVSFSRSAVLRAVGVLLGILAYILLVERLGFAITAGVFLISMMLILGVRPRIAVPVSVGLVLFVQLLFERLLLVPLPRGDISLFTGS